MQRERQPAGSGLGLTWRCGRSPAHGGLLDEIAAVTGRDVLRVGEHLPHTANRAVAGLSSRAPRQPERNQAPRRPGPCGSGYRCFLSDHTGIGPEDRGPHGSITACLLVKENPPPPRYGWGACCRRAVSARGRHRRMANLTRYAVAAARAPHVPGADQALMMWAPGIGLGRTWTRSSLRQSWPGIRAPHMGSSPRAHAAHHPRGRVTSCAGQFLNHWASWR